MPFPLAFPVQPYLSDSYSKTEFCCDASPFTQFYPKYSSAGTWFTVHLFKRAEVQGGWLDINEGKAESYNSIIPRKVSTFT
jgi:hypothetical protein